MQENGHVHIHKSFGLVWTHAARAVQCDQIGRIGECFLSRCDHISKPIRHLRPKKMIVSRQAQ